MSSISLPSHKCHETLISEIIEGWKTNIIAFSCLGISRINILLNKQYHSAVLLLQKEIYDYDEDEIENEIGIVIEYGDYSPNMSKEESENVKKGRVIYHYGDKGGLRYYVKTYGEFIKEFTDIGYVDLNIEPEKQQTFEHFISKIAKKEDNKWIKEKYSSYDFNCQTFSAEVIKVLKPYFYWSNIYPTDKDLFRRYKKRIEFIPYKIRTELMNFYKNRK